MSCSMFKTSPLEKEGLRGTLKEPLPQSIEKSQTEILIAVKKQKAGEINEARKGS